MSFSADISWSPRASTRAQVSSRRVRTSKQMYADMLNAVNTETTFPLVLNFFRCKPSSPISEKNCLLPANRSQHNGRPRAPNRLFSCPRRHTRIERTLLPSKQAYAQDARAVHSEQGADAVELGREDLQNDKGEAELPDGCSDVSTFECSLRRTNFDELGGGKDDGVCAVHAQMIPVCGVASLSWSVAYLVCQSAGTYFEHVCAVESVVVLGRVLKEYRVEVGRTFDWNEMCS